jgi:DNA-binding NtrC family response regulator
VIDDPPDLIITDLRMPRCDGGELIRRVHALIPGLPVIVATGHLGHLETAATALQEVSVAVLKKPISLSHLSDLVKTHIDLP